MADLKIVIRALNNASGDLNKVKTDIKEVGNSGTTAKTGVEEFGSSLGSLMTKGALITAAVAATAKAIKEVYNAAKEAAELDYATTKFDNLAASIGTVSSALMDDLRAATDGMVSDANLIKGAGDLMALGLAKSHEEVVRLTTVAGALGMNMNQLVLTLTNKTTMRFDALGVSVAGFDEKVKALEESGLSVEEAFTEAFLQQAEEQIAKVGSASDQSIGSFMRLEAAVDNLTSSMKDGLLPVIAPVAEGLAELITNMTPRDMTRMPEFINLLSTAFERGAIDGTTYDQMLRDVNNGFISIPDGINQVNDALTVYNEKTVQSSAANQQALISLFNTTSSWSEFAQEAERLGIDLVMVNEEIYNSEKANYALNDSYKPLATSNREMVESLMESSNSWEEFKDTAHRSGIKIDGVTEAMWNASYAARESTIQAVAYHKALGEQSSITSYTSGLNTIVNTAQSMDKILKEIVVQEEIMANNPIGSEKYDEAKGKVEELKGAMQSLANSVVFSMMQANIEIGGVTKAEMQGLMDVGVQMGMFTQEAVDLAIAAWDAGAEAVNNTELDPKTLEVDVDDTAVEVYQAPDGKWYIRTIVDDSAVDNYNPPNKTATVTYVANGSNLFNRAVGGSVNAGQPYTWQEYGYRGEVFVPSADGFVLSRADAERALARALYGGGSAISPEEIGKAVAQAMSGITSNKKGGNVYNLTMPTSSNPADIRTAFELMEAWA